jgi:hypothetical protein
MSRNKALRIAVGEENNRRSSTWRIWMGPQDIYAGFRVIAGIRKISIHFPRPGLSGTLRYIGYTKNYAQSLSGQTELTREQRTQWEWPGTEIAPDYFMEFRFRIPESELRLLDCDGADDIVWISPPPEGMATEVAILSGPSTHKGVAPQRSDGARIEYLLEERLPNGRWIWVLHHIIPAPPPEDMRKFRQQVYSEMALHRRLPPTVPVGKNTRVNLTMDCGDGSLAEVELAADFLNSAAQ